jgi:hypothetical protein
VRHRRGIASGKTPLNTHMQGQEDQGR